MTVSGETPQCAVLATDCFCGEPREAAALVLGRVEERRGGYACFANAHVLVTALHDVELRRSLDEAWQVFPDGAPVAWTERRSGNPDAHRVPGPDLMPMVFELGQPFGVRHYLLGASDEVIESLRRRLRERYPDARVVGSASPSLVDAWAPTPGLLEAIRAAEPDLVWCALGAPKQELWMRSNYAALAPALLLGVGAAFDFVAGSKPRAPAFLRAHGLEWLHRLLSEPRRLTGRYVRTNSEFVLRATVQLLRSVPR